MRASVLLADYACVESGKLTVVGAGWYWTHVFRCGVGVQIVVPWSETNRDIQCLLTLVDADGQVVPMKDAKGDVTGTFAFPFMTRVVPPEGMVKGTNFYQHFAFNFTLPLDPGWYEMRLFVDGKHNPEHSAAFEMRSIPAPTV